MADINLDIALDDKQLIDALNRTERELKQIEKAADDAGDEITKSMRQADKATEQLNKELAKTDRQLDKVGKTADKTNSKLSSQIRNFRRNGVGVFAGIATGALAAAAAIDKTIDAFVPLAGVQKRTAEAAGEAIGAFVEERTQLNQLAIAATDAAASDEERELAKKALIEQYKEYLPTIEEDLKTTDALTLANTRLKDAIIERTATQATEAIKAQLIEDIGIQLLEERQKQFAALTQGGISGTLAGIRQIQAASAGLQSDAIKAQLQLLDLAKEDIKAVLKELDGDIIGVGATTKLTTDEIEKLAGKTAKPAKEAKEEYKILEGSLADLQKQLAAINKLITEQTAAGDIAALTPLIEQAKELETAIEEAQAAIDELRSPTTAIPEIPGISATVETFEELEQKLNDANALRIQQLKTAQEQELARLKIAGITEEDLTALQAKQEKERQRLALETEQKRLEFLLQYGTQRSEAERKILQEQVKAIEAELSALDTVVAETIEQPEDDKAKGLLGRLGFDEESAKAIEAGAKIAIDNLQELFDKQVEIATKQVELRNENIQNLQERLDQELRLNEQGFASNVALVQQELEEERKAREKALADQKRARQAQLILETATQASNLATSASQIFSTFAALPFGIGIPIAAGVIAAMIGSFIALKAQAFKAASQNFAEGGLLPSPEAGGRSDKYGGRGHRIEDTNIVVGGGEFVVNAKDTGEHSDFLKNLNAGKYNGIDLVGIINGRAARTRKMQRNSELIIANKRSDNATSERLDKVIKYLDVILSKPSIVSTKEGYMEQTIDINKNRILKNIKIK